VAYHSVTWGPIAGGLLRRVAGASVRGLIRDEIARPLGLRRLSLGIPADAPAPARLVAPAALEPTAEPSDPIAYAALNHPPLFSPAGLEAWNGAAYRQAEIPAASLVASAADLARVYAALVDGSGRLLRPETVALGCQTRGEGVDRLTGTTRRFGVGWHLWHPGSRLGADERAFGHAGAGGSIAGAWPSHGLGFAYVPNALYADERYESRSHALLTALAGALGRAA
jgi:CubicO group peptidase (beta-lactamase class C family)